MLNFLEKFHPYHVTSFFDILSNEWDQAFGNRNLRNLWYLECDVLQIIAIIMDNKNSPFHGVFTTFVTTAAVVVWLQVQNWKQWEHVDDGGNVLTTRSVAMIWSNEFLTNI